MVSETQNYSLRLCFLLKNSFFQTFGINLLQEDGHIIGKIEPDSPAEKGGLKEKDRIIEINYENIEQKSFQEVEEIIKREQGEIIFLVVDPESDQYLKKENLKVDSKNENVLKIGFEEHLKLLSEGHKLLWANDPSHKARKCHLKLWESYDGYGFNLHIYKDSKKHVIGKVDEDSPAQKAGLKQEDVMVEVDDENVQNLSHKEVVEKIKNKNGGVTFLVVDKEAQEFFESNQYLISHNFPFIEEIFCPDDPKTNQDIHAVNQPISSVPNSNVISEQVVTINSTNSQKSDVNEIQEKSTKSEMPFGISSTDSEKGIIKICHLKIWEGGNGFGFNMQSEVGKPGQYIIKVEPNSPAFLANLKEKDLILGVNGTSVKNMKHEEVVFLIKKDLSETKLTLVDPESKKIFEEKELDYYEPEVWSKHSINYVFPEFQPSEEGVVKSTSTKASSQPLDSNSTCQNKEKEELILNVKNIPKPATPISVTSTTHSTPGSGGVTINNSNIPSPTQALEGILNFAATAEEARKRLVKKKLATQQMSMQDRYALYQKL